MRFVAVDVETANARMRSICQIGIVVFEDGEEVYAESLLVDPQDDFHFMNISIHGIYPEHVIGAPNYPTANTWLSGHISDQFVVCHTHFDRVAILQADIHHGLNSAPCRWIDSAKVARRAWPQVAYGGYGLRNLADAFGIPLRHHDALEDARAAGLILLRAVRETGLDLGQWIERCRLGLSGHRKGLEKREGDGDGPLLGETVVFTGALSMFRSVAADLAHVAGGRVEPGVTKETTILVVGDQDLTRLGGKERSRKHLKAEQLAAKGQPIRILAESDFIALVVEESPSH